MKNSEEERLEILKQELRNRIKVERNEKTRTISGDNNNAILLDMLEDFLEKLKGIKNRDNKQIDSSHSGTMGEEDSAPR